MSFGTVMTGLGFGAMGGASLFGALSNYGLASEQLDLSRSYQNQMAQYYANQTQLASNQLNEANRQFNVSQAFLKKQFDYQKSMDQRNFDFTSDVYNQQFAFQREQMDWLDQMARTQHQREVADLRASGLNPILSSGGMGSAMPSTVSSVGAPVSGTHIGVGSSTPTASGSAAAQFASNAGHALSSAASVSSALADAGIRGFSSAIAGASDLAKASKELAMYPAESKALAKQAEKSGKLAELYGEQALTESTTRKAKLGLMQAQADAAATSSNLNKKHMFYADQNYIERWHNLQALNKYLDRAGLAQQVKAWSSAADTFFRGIDTGVNVFTKGIYRKLKPDFPRSSSDRQLFDPESFINPQE